MKEKEFRELHGLFLEDLKVGQEAMISKTVTESDIVFFSGVSGDNNPVHISDEFAEKTLFKREEPNIKNLCNLFVKATNKALLRFCPSFPFDEYNLLAEGWVNIGSKLSFNYPHNHPGSNFSGIYYVKVPTKRKDSGLLQFLDPRGGVRPYALGVKELKDPFNDNFTIVPDEKMLIIFPSWLQHWVTPNLQEEDRISIACNFIFQKK